MLFYSKNKIADKLSFDLITIIKIAKGSLPFSQESV